MATHQTHGTTSMPTSAASMSDLQPLFTSWAHFGTVLRQRMALARIRLGRTGATPGSTRLHLPCRHNGGTYSVPVAMQAPVPAASTQPAGAPGQHAHVQLAICRSADASGRDWRQDAAATRFAVLARGREQVVVELVPPAAPITLASRAPLSDAPADSSPHALTLHVILPAPYRAPVATPPAARPLALPTQTATTSAASPQPSRPRLPILT